MSNEKAPSAKGYKLANGKSNLEITGLPMKVTNDNLNNPNVIKAIQNHERRTGRKIIGNQIVFA